MNKGVVVAVPSVDRRQDSVSVATDRRCDKGKSEDVSLFCALETIPPVRRAISIPDKIEHGEITSALGMASLALINLPEDLRDIKSALDQFKGVEAKYKYKEYQHDFSFFRGTAIEEWLHGQIQKGKKWAKWLYRNDLTLADTAFGEKILNSVKAKLSEDIAETPITNFIGKQVYAFKYEGSKFAQLTGRALRRTTKLGVLAIALLEVPKIFNAIQNGETVKQTAKSAINVASITAGIGYGGAIGAKHGGAIGSLVGMGFGAVLGCKLSQKTQELI